MHTINVKKEMNLFLLIKTRTRDNNENLDPILLSTFSKLKLSNKITFVIELLIMLML